MPSTSQMRTMYPELVVSRNPLRCDYTNTTLVEFAAAGTFGDTVQLRVHPATAEAFRALSAVFRAWNYRFWDPAGGTCVCRPITGGTAPSLHAVGVALDINPTTNRYRHTILRGLIQWGKQTDMPKGMVVAAEAIRTKGGFPVFEWGGRWNTIKDPMHWQPSKCTRAQLERGIDWATVQGKPIEGEDEMVLKQGDTGNAVRLFQKCLNVQGAGQGLVEDGVFGALTVAAVRRYQNAADLPTTGEIDGILAGCLARYDRPRG